MGANVPANPRMPRSNTRTFNRSASETAQATAYQRPKHDMSPTGERTENHGDTPQRIASVDRDGLRRDTSMATDERNALHGADDVEEVPGRGTSAFHARTDLSREDQIAASNQGINLPAHCSSNRGLSEGCVVGSRRGDRNGYEGDESRAFQLIPPRSFPRSSRPPTRAA